MSMTGSKMKHRVRIQRNDAVTDTWGSGKVSPSSFNTVKDGQRCLITMERGREIVDGDKVIQVDSLLGIFPPDVDLQRGDKLVNIVNRKGDEVIAGTLEVDTINTIPSEFGKSHVEATLRRHRK